MFYLFRAAEVLVVATNGLIDCSIVPSFGSPCCVILPLHRLLLDVDNES